jgi:hypothetical protein
LEKEGWVKPVANESNIMDQVGDGIPERIVEYDRGALTDPPKPVARSNVALKIGGEVTGIPLEGLAIRLGR